MSSVPRPSSESPSRQSVSAPPQRARVSPSFPPRAGARNEAAAQATPSRAVDPPDTAFPKCVEPPFLSQTATRAKFKPEKRVKRGIRAV
eukprot:9475207-Pyramimonas_sp.AAC.1